MHKDVLDITSAMDRSVTIGGQRGKTTFHTPQMEGSAQFNSWT